MNICGSHKRMKLAEAGGTRRASEPVDQKRASSLPRYLCSSGLLLLKHMRLAGVGHAAGGFPDDSDCEPGTHN